MIRCSIQLATKLEPYHIAIRTILLFKVSTTARAKLGFNQSSGASLIRPPTRLKLRVIRYSGSEYGLCFSLLLENCLNLLLEDF